MISVKGVLIDLEGVVYLGENVVQGATNAIKRIKAKNIQIRYLTNTTTVTRQIILEKLNDLNIPANINEIFTPVMAANNYLNNLKISKIFLLTEEILKSDFKNFIFEEKKPEAIILGDIYKKFNWDKLNQAFKLINDNNSLIIALHKNKYCRRAGEISLDLGAFVKALEFASSRKAIVMGKPEKNFFNLAIEDMNLKNTEVMMIGDDILSDILGAKNNGIFSIQVKTGKYQIEDETNKYQQPDERINSIKDLPELMSIN